MRASLPSLPIWAAVAALVAALLSPYALGSGRSPSPPLPRSPGTCLRAVIEGEVRAGSLLRQTIGGGLDLLLEPIPSGWVLRVFPSTPPRPAIDFAELGTPPYRSVNPLLISTDFSFRAQDAVAWNPRHFRFVPTRRSFAELEAVYRGYISSPHPSPDSEAQLSRLVSRLPEGSIEILDASLVPGTADQVPAASLVATHWESTPHRLEQVDAGKALPLGRISSLRLRITLDLPRGLHPAAGVRAAPYACR